MADVHSVLSDFSTIIEKEGRVRAQRLRLLEAFALVDRAAQRCCWGRGLDETEFEPFLPGDNVERWFRRLCTRLPKFAVWLVEERMVPLARELWKTGSAVKVKPEELIAFELAIDPNTGHGAARAFARDRFRQLVAKVEDMAVRRAECKKLAEALAQDPVHVPPLFFLEYFEVLRSHLARRGEAAIAALTRPKAGVPAHAKPRPPAVQPSPPGPASAPAEPEGPAVDREIRHAPDFSSLRARGTTYHFTTPLQRAVIAALFAEWERLGGVDGCGLTVSALAETIKDAGEGPRLRLRMDRLFNEHPAVDTILMRSGRSVWVLHLKGPEKAQS